MKKLIVIAAIGVVALLAIQLVSYRKGLEQEVRALNVEAMRLASTQSSFKTGQPLVQMLENRLKTQRLEKSLVRFEAQHGAVRLRFNEIELARLSRFLSEIEQHGFSVRELTLASNAKAGFASAELEVGN